MKSKKSTTPRTTDADELRHVAEAKLSLLKKKTASLRNTDTEFLRLIHELEVHQIELEMQNEELTQSRAEAEATRDQYTDLYDFGPVGYFTLTGDGKIQKTNLLGAKLLGTERGNLIGWRFGQFVAPESRSIFNAFLEKIFSTGANHESCELVLQKDGSDPVWVHLEAAVDREQAVCRVAVVDISDRRRVQDALLLSEQKFLVMFEKAPFSASLSGALDGRIEEVNQEFKRLFGFSRQEAVGRTFLELGIYPDPEERKRAITRVQERGYGRNAEMKLLTKAGEARDFLINSDFIEIGAEKHVLTTAQDITEHKRAQDELRLSRDRLADLSRRLVESHEEEARAIGRELHDQIGQMLTALKLTLDILPHLPAKLSAKKLAGAQELVDDLMNRVSTLSLELRPPMLDDLGIIPALLWHINRFQERSGVIIVFEHSGIKNRRFDSQIETTAYRIVQESLTNVARHAEATQVQIAVRALEPWMEIRIEDNGKGFDSETALAKYRGLSAMRERVHLIGGNFQIESQLGKGTKKCIKLPLIVERAS